MTINLFYDTTLFQWPLRMYLRKYRKRPVPGNGLKISLTNVSAECWYSCLFHNRTLLSYSRSVLVLSMHSRGIKFKCFPNEIDFKEHLSVTVHGK